MLATCMHYRWMDTLKKNMAEVQLILSIACISLFVLQCTQICMHMYVYIYIIINVYIYICMIYPCTIVNGIWILGVVNFNSGKVEYI